MEHRFPVALGRDFAGTVDRVGADVTGFAEGDDVFGLVLTQPLHAGGFGEYVVMHFAGDPVALAGLLRPAGRCGRKARQARGEIA